MTPGAWLTVGPAPWESLPVKVAQGVSLPLASFLTAYVQLYVTNEVVFTVA